MTPEESRESFLLFQEAWELGAGERNAFLDARCADRPQVRERVVRLIEQSERGMGLLTGGVLRLAIGPSVADPDAGSSIGPRDASELVSRGVPHQIGRYHVRRLIGVGGMGAVYEAQQAQTGRRVAIKLVRAAALSTDAVRRIHREARVLGRLRHPGVAQIYEAGVCRIGGVKQPYIVMEYLEGEPLNRYAHGRSLTIEQKLLLIAAVCDALQHAHQRGVIHRDLKPANIIVDRVAADTPPPDSSRPPGQPRIIDFGVAMLSLGDEAASLTLNTGTGQVLGTLPYMSPEQIAGVGGAGAAESDEVDTRSDVYSVGVMLFELLTGRLPHPCTGGLLEAVAAARSGRPAPRARQLAPDLPADVEAIVAKALELQPSRRYQSASDLALDIRRFLANEPVQARALTTGYILSRLIRRNRRRVAAAAVLCMAGLAGAGAAFVQIALAKRDAQLRLQQARATADFLIDEVVTELEQISGTASINRRVIERVLADTEQFLAEHAADERLLHNHAVLLMAMANIDEHEGRRAEALPRMARAVEIRERLAAASPDDAERAMNLSVACVRLGDINLHLGSRDATRTLYRRSLAIDESLAQREPGNRRYLDNLGYSYERLALFLADENDDGAAEPLHRRRLEIAALTFERFPEHPLSLLGVCSAHAQYSGFLLAQGRLAEAAPHARSAREHADRLVRENPDHVYYARYAFVAYVAHAKVLHLAGDEPGALDCYRAALAIARRQMREEPRAEWPPQACFHMHAVVAELSDRLGDRAAAAASWTEMLRMSEAGRMPITADTLEQLLAPARAGLARVASDPAR